MINRLIIGQVVKGKGEGRQIGYPTANLQLMEKSYRAPLGIYAAWVKLNNKKQVGILVSGVEQDSTGEPRQEVYLLDYSGNLYDQVLQIEIVTRLRDLIKAENIEEMKHQIDQDIKTTRKIFNL